MITPSARTGFERLMAQSLKKAFSPSADDSFEVVEASSEGGFTETSLVVLTSSSYVFRLMVFIYFSEDVATRAYFARRSSSNTEEFTAQAFVDAICETANLCCGGINRELGRFFPHIGLSTPNILERNCADHIEALNAGLVKHFGVDVNGTTLFHASMCICDYDTLDFHYVATAQEETAMDGELELF